jgi:hypothetical protein
MEPFRLYTSETASPGVALLASLMETEHGRPVHIRPLSEMPAADRQRPTRQQLLTERADVAACLSSIEQLLAQAQADPHRYADQAALLRQDRDRHQVRRQELNRLLGQEEGGVEL